MYCMITDSLRVSLKNSHFHYFVYTITDHSKLGILPALSFMSIGLGDESGWPSGSPACCAFC